MVERKPRTDSLRNRTRLLEEAKLAFSAKGSDASLEEIARAAEVGIGTLYRHFPTRDALIEAVYRQESGQLVDAATELAKTHPPLAALRAWLLLFVDFMETKQGMSEAFNSIVCGTSELYADSSAQVSQALEKLTARAVKNGDIRLTIEPLDLLRSLAGLAYVSAGPNWKRNAKQLVDVLLEGMRSRD
jgi:AcrR family transcriptional regulator